MKKKFLLVLLLALTLSLAGCEGGATATGIRDQCRHSNLSGSCTLTIGTLTGGAWTYRVENSNLRRAGGPVQVTVNVTVGTGTVNVWVEEGSNRSNVTVAAGGSAEMSGTASVSGTGDERYFRIYFEPQGEGDAKRAENIQAEIQYQAP
jgi:hypothetical protein